MGAISQYGGKEKVIQRIKHITYVIIEPSIGDSFIDKSFNVGMLFLIILNVFAVILQTEEPIYQKYETQFYAFEVFSVIIFSVEYILRLWTCTEIEEYKHPIWGRIRFAFTASMIIDLLSILPFYIPFRGLDLRIIRAARLFRLFRIFKIGRYSQSLTRLSNVIKSKKEELVITLFSAVVLLIIASSVMYFVEKEAQPDVFGSIPDAMWWGAVTLTTVGYGDVYPITLLGKIISAFIAVLGIGLFALPAGIIASGFASELQKKDEKIICPHCGKEIN